MTRYLEPGPFSSKAASKEYTENFEKMFGKKCIKHFLPADKKGNCSRCLEELDKEKEVK